MRRDSDLDKVTEQHDIEKQMYDGLCKRRLDEFTTGFNTISPKLKETYQVRNFCRHHFHCGKLHQRPNEERSIYHHLASVWPLATDLCDTRADGSASFLSNDIFELSHRLIGIHKTSNATRSKL